MDDLLERADRAIRDSELIRRQVDENIELARYWNARVIATVSRTREEAARSHQSRAERVRRAEAAQESLSPRKTSS